MSFSRFHGRLARDARRLAEIPLSDLAVLFAPVLCPSALLPSARHRLYTSERTFWLFLHQVLANGKACREAVHHFNAGITAAGHAPISPDTSSYCAARARLKNPGLMAVSTRVVEHIEKQARPEWLWHGHNVKPVDGSSLSMPDTPANQAEWPQSKRQAKGCGFPVMRIVALFSLATGALVAHASGPFTKSERALFAELWNHLHPGDIALGDRGFCGYGDYCELQQRGVHSVMREVQRLKIGGALRVVERLGKDDLLLEWKRGMFPSLGRRTREQWAALPESITVRQIRVMVEEPGFRTKEMRLLTTLLDPKKYPAQDFAELYRRRWEAELHLRSIKTAMGMDVLRCKSPEMIRKEVMMFVIAYNLVRAVMVEAALLKKVDIGRLSFAGSAAAVREWSPKIARERSARKRRKLYRLMLCAIAKDLVPDRPNRREPRAVKRRTKGYALLNKPRRQYVDIPHRNKYTKEKYQAAKG